VSIAACPHVLGWAVSVSVSVVVGFAPPPPPSDGISFLGALGTSGAFGSAFGVEVIAGSSVGSDLYPGLNLPPPFITAFLGLTGASVVGACVSAGISLTCGFGLGPVFGLLLSSNGDVSDSPVPATFGGGLGVALGLLVTDGCSTSMWLGFLYVIVVSG